MIRSCLNSRLIVFLSAFCNLNSQNLESEREGDYGFRWKFITLIFSPSPPSSSHIIITAVTTTAGLPHWGSHRNPHFWISVASLSISVQASPYLQASVHHFKPPQLPSSPSPSYFLWPPLEDPQGEFLFNPLCQSWDNARGSTPGVLRPLIYQCCTTNCTNGGATIA